MSYHDLSECTLSSAERLEEALCIIEILQDYQDELHSHELDMMHRVECGASVSSKMLFWLRDIKDRVME
jgi:hypothetical protein